MNDYLQRVNSAPFYGIVAGVLGFITIMCFVFLMKSYRAGLRIGMDKRVLKKTILSSATFTLLPSISILLGVVALSGTLGVPLSWLRLSVIGSFSYETIAANIFKGNVTDATAYVTVALVMTCGMLVSMFLPLITGKKIQRGLMRMRNKDKKWGDIFNNAMFLGMISAFLGYVFCDVGDIFKGSTAGLIPVCVMATSAVIMAVCGLISKKLKVRWITDYALPLSLVGGMASAIPYTSWLG